MSCLSCTSLHDHPLRIRHALTDDGMCAGKSDEIGRCALSAAQVSLKQWHQYLVSAFAHARLVHRMRARTRAMHPYTPRWSSSAFFV
eukprot:1122681-Prymnesium_polylepis.1